MKSFHFGITGVEYLQMCEACISKQAAPNAIIRIYSAVYEKFPFMRPPPTHHKETKRRWSKVERRLAARYQPFIRTCFLHLPLTHVTLLNIYFFANRTVHYDF